MSNEQVEANYKAYHEQFKDKLEHSHFGKIALMHDGEIVKIYNDEGDAYSIGCDQFGLGNFSIVVIGRPPARLSARITIPV